MRYVNHNVARRCISCYISGMAKTDTLGVRLDPNEKAALERAAAADDRPVSALARKIIAEWLAKNGWMMGGKK